MVLNFLMVRIKRIVMKRMEILKRNVKNPMRRRMPRISKKMARILIKMTSVSQTNVLKWLNLRRETTTEIWMITVNATEQEQQLHDEAVAPKNNCEALFAQPNVMQITLQSLVQAQQKHPRKPLVYNQLSFPRDYNRIWELLGTLGTFGNFWDFPRI
jgi:hypothetical protein